MAHNVTFTIPDRELGNADLEFTVKKNKAKFGTLKISKGAVVWLPKDFTYGYQLTWDQLSEIMKENGKRKNG
ncbi:MAG: hypothetical protein ACTHMV_00550 [Chitinophagaceae bacterium]